MDYKNSTATYLIKYSVCTIVCYLLSHIQLFATPWTVAHQGPLSRKFSRQEYWSGLPFPSPEDLPNPGMEPESLALHSVSLPSEQAGNPIKYNTHYNILLNCAGPLICNFFLQ